jgi:hypothetical protein
MPPGENRTKTVSAVEVRDHVTDLQLERALALSSGLGGVDAYMHDLDEEIDFWRHHYVVVAVTEIATLHAELFGASRG